jgi:cell wall-associated NlpC family hydrolase
VRLSQAISRDPVIRILKRQAPALVIVIAAACIAAGTATGDPSISAKQAQAQAIMAQMTQLDGSLQRATNLYYDSTRKLHAIEHSLKINKIALHAARVNLRRSQAALMQRLVTIYTSRNDQSTLAVLLGSQSIDDLVNRIEAVKSVSSQDVAVMNEVIGFKKAVTIHQHALATAHRSQARLVHQRAAAKARVSSQLAREQRLYASVKGEIARLIQANQARQLALARAATLRNNSQAQAQALALQQTAIGASASVGSASVAPPSQYTGVVGIAMRYLGVPYVWGGSSPSGFDCSGLVAYVYAQVGVSLPHYTGAQWNVGVPVSRSDLQPGDLVFFDGLGHVGIYIGGNAFIHAPHTGDVVRISSISGWYADTYVGARRITG